MLIAQWGSGLADGLRMASQALLKPVQLDPFVLNCRESNGSPNISARVGPFKDDAFAAQLRSYRFWDLEGCKRHLAIGDQFWIHSMDGSLLEIEEQSLNKITRRIAPRSRRSHIACKQ